MEKERLTIKEQAAEAVRAVDRLFGDGCPPIPEGATKESLWQEVCRLQGKVKKPRKVDAIKLLLEDDRFTGLSVALIADIIKQVFKRAGIPCDTSESSIRWYISQKTLEWSIKPRDKGQNMVEIEY